MRVLLVRKFYNQLKYNTLTKKLFTILSLLSILIVGCNKSDKETKGTKIMTVTSEQRDCFLLDRFPSYLVKTDDVAGWHTMTESIVGFEYTPGYEYVLEVKEIVKQDPPQDWLGEYQLIKVISKVQKNSENLPPQTDWPK